VGEASENIRLAHETKLPCWWPSSFTTQSFLLVGGPA